MNERGELTSGEIISIVLVIAGTILLLLFLPPILDLFGEGQDREELCRLSVISRATDPIVSTQSLIPLRCTTQKICISEAGDEDDCVQFAGEKDKYPAELKSKDNSGRAEEIEAVIAQEMLDCWDIMGQGRLDLFAEPTDFTGVTEVRPTCVICSRIAVERRLLEDSEFQKNVVQKINLRDYINDPDHKVGSTGKTYSEVFFGTGVHVPAVIEGSPEDVQKEINLELLDTFLRENGIEKKSSDQLAVVFSQTVTKNTPEDIGLRTGVGTSLGTFALVANTPVAGQFFTRTAWTGLPLLIGASLGAGITTGLMAGYQTLDNRDFSAAYCGQFTSSSEDPRSGCSVVKVTAWDPDTINSLCSGGIEGNL